MQEHIFVISMSYLVNDIHVLFFVIIFYSLSNNQYIKQHICGLQRSPMNAHFADLVKHSTDTYEETFGDYLTLATTYEHRVRNYSRLGVIYF